MLRGGSDRLDKKVPPAQRRPLRGPLSFINPLKKPNIPFRWQITDNAACI